MRGTRGLEGVVLVNVLLLYSVVARGCQLQYHVSHISDDGRIDLVGPSRTPYSDKAPRPFVLPH